MKEALPNTHNGSDLVTFFERALSLIGLILIVRANHIANILKLFKNQKPPIFLSEAFVLGVSIFHIKWLQI